MNKNIGKIDTIIRIIVGISIGAWGIYAKNWFGLVGIVPILTAFIKFCPLYLRCGINTGKKE